MAEQQAQQLIREATERRYSRRQIIQRAAAIGLSASVVSTILAACGGSNATETPKASGATSAPAATSGTSASTTAASTAAPAAASSAAPAATTTAGSAVAGAPAAGGITLPTGDAKNPLKVKEDAPLDVVIFKGGYGDDYAVNAEKIYAAAFPKAKVSHQGIQRLAEQLQPRFVGGNPPDIMDNSGAGNLDTAALVAEGQLADLADLMSAPSFDTPGKTFKDSLLPNSQVNGVYDGKQFVLNYVLSVYGIWYSDALMKKNGWEYPKTWDSMLALCEKIKTAGIAPWAYQGKYPQYMTMVMDQMVFKQGGIQAIAKIDNLEPNAWRQPEVKNAVDALYQLADKGYLLPGTEGLTHTESQAEWLKNKAVFIPCGSWLENEEKGLVPDGFNMVVQPTPSLSASDKVPFAGIQSSAGEGFIVASKGKNVAGGKEFLRILYSKQGARFFSENTKSLTVVQGSADGLKLGSAFESVQAANTAAGANVFVAQYGTWYKKLQDEAKDKMGALLTKQIKPADFIDNVQKMADDVAKDDSIKKYKRQV